MIEEEPKKVEVSKKRKRKSTKIEFIEDKSRRQTTFSRRKKGLMKKMFELITLTGTQGLLIIASDSGHVHTFATAHLRPVVVNPYGKELISACLSDENDKSIQ